MIEPRLELAQPEEQIEEDVRLYVTRKEIAKTYSLALRVTSRPVNWSRINRAILTRFQPSSLDWIKRQAWSGKCFEVTE